MDALEYDDTSDDVNPAGALEEILMNPEKLKVSICKFCFNWKGMEMFE